MEISDLIYIDSTGYHFADYPTFLQFFIDKTKAVYGADLYLEPDSQDGQNIAISAKAAYDEAAAGASTYNSFSPVTAQGAGLSRVVKINGLTRLVPSFSTVDLVLVGQTGTVITNGIATDSLGQKWLLPSPTTIPFSGTITVTATAELVGAVTAEAATITSIFTPTLGWQTVNNVAAATPGSAVESDAELRLRQAGSTANPSLTVFDGTVGAVQNIAGVTKVVGYENDTNSTDGNSIPAHSISVVVAGGVTADICQAIQVHKTPGTGTFGDTSATVYDSHGMPLLIKFERAVTATIHVVVTLAAGVGWSTDYEALIQTAVGAVINAGKIGDVILLTKLYAPAYLNGLPQGQTYVISSITIGKNATPPAGSNITLAWNENPVTDPATNITFVVT